MTAGTPAPQDAETELAQLRRWKAEVLPVIQGLQEVGRALGIGLGKRITGRDAVDAALDLRNERDQAIADRAREVEAARRDGAREALLAAAEEVGRVGVNWHGPSPAMAWLRNRAATHAETEEP